MRFWQQQPPEIVAPSRRGIMAGGVGLVMCGPSTRELYTNRPITTNAGLASTARGVGRLCSSTTVGVYTARREWANWEITTAPFSLIALWQLDSLAGSSVRVLGYSAGGTGYSIGQSITGQRRYSIGATNAETISPLWPLGVPISSVMTYDGTNINGWFNGVLDATVASGSVTFGTFDRIGAGGDPDGEYRLDGKVLYFGLIARVLSAVEIQRLALNPYAVYAPVRRFVPVMVSAGGVISGVLASTLDAVTSSAAGTVLIQGTASPTLADVTSTATGTVKVQGTLSSTLSDATLSSAGGAGVASLVLAKTLADVTSAATGTVQVQGTLSKTVDDVTLSATASVAAAILTLNATLADATLSAAGTVKIQGSASPTLGDVTPTIAGAIKVQGVLTETLADVVLLSSGGNAPAQLTLAATLADVSASAAGVIIVSAVVAKSLDDATLVSTGTVKVSGTLSKTLGDVTLVAIISQAVTGALAATLGNVTLVSRGRGPFERSPERTVVVTAEDRRFTVVPEDRSSSVVPEWRAFTVIPEDRSSVVIPETREASP